MSSSKAAKSKRIEVPDHEALSPTLAAAPGAVVSGEVVERMADGSVFVNFPQNTLGPLRARTLVVDIHAGSSVLIAFDGGDPTRPIILGILHDRARTEARTLHLKAARIVLEAEDELALKCGEGSIEARRDGKVSVKGRDVISRATRTNKVRGATVLIN
jgi:hypothetical protein